MRDKLLELYSIDVQIIEGGGGIFEVSHMNRILFSKKISGHFPTNQDLQQLDLVAKFDA